MIFQRLQAWQDKNDVSDAELARRVGVAQSTIYRAKRGQRDLHMRFKLKIQEITGIAPSEFADFLAQVVQAQAKPQKKSARAEAAA